MKDVDPHARGRRAELAVEDYLFARGFEVLERNVRLGRLELDLVARKGELCVVVEVRTRGEGSYVGALASVDGVKRRRLLLAVERLWRERLSRMDGIERVRIDVAAVRFASGRTEIEYVQGAVVGGMGRP